MFFAQALLKGLAGVAVLDGVQPLNAELSCRQAALSESQRGFAVGSYGFMKSRANSHHPLGFPRGEAGFFDNRHFGTDCQKRLMRDGVHRKFDEGFGEWRKVLVL